MFGMIPPFLRNLDTVKFKHSVISALRDGMKDHLVGVHESKIVMAKDILCTLATNSHIGSGRGLVALLRIDMRNIIRAKGRRLLLDNVRMLLGSTIGGKFELTSWLIMFVLLWNIGGAMKQLSLSIIKI